MKKFLAVLVVFAMVAGTVFADNPEVSVKVGGKASTNLFYAANGSGDWDTGAGGDDGSGKISNLEKGSTDFLSWNEGPGTDGWDATLGLTLSVEGAEAGVDFILSKKDGSKHGFNNDGDPALSLGDLLFLDGWHLSGTAGIFDAYIGTGDYKGKASSVGGINLPFWIDDKAEGGNLNLVENGGLFAIGIQPMDLLKISLGTSLNPTGGPNAWRSQSNINAAFLVSLVNLADVVTFDIFYGIKGGDSNTLSSPTNGALWANTFGLYLDLNVVDNLGIFLGYTAKADVVEVEKGGDDGKKAIPVNNPLYNGIDVNVKFTVNEQLGIHLNNNLSFASVEGSDGKDVVNNGFNDVADKKLGNSGRGLAKDEKADYFVYIGELGGNYAVSDALGLSLTLTEKLGTAGHSEKDASGDTSTLTFTKNYFEAFFKASYNIGPVTLESGLALGLNNSSVLAHSDASGAKDQTANASSVVFSVPIFFKLAF